MTKIKRFLVIGSGAREHALCWRLAHEAEVFCAPGSPGIGDDVPCSASVAASDTAEIIRLAKRLSPVTVVVGPEDPLIAGLGTALRREGIPVFGPGEDGAELEGSKAFSKELMSACGVPTAAFQTFCDYDAAAAYAKSRCDADGGVVVKASGNALGKGAIVCDDFPSAESALNDMLVAKKFGAAGETVVVEQRLQGFEFSLLTLVSGRHFRSLPVAQDYKRALDGDRGPNTGGMGSYCPSAKATPSLVAAAEDEIVRPMVDALADRGIDYRGVLFSGVMVHQGRPYCLEYNVRFGDPETQSVMMRVVSALASALAECAGGREIPDIEIDPRPAVTVVVAAPGYPDSPVKGQPITLPGERGLAKLFHAGVRADGQKLVVAGGRVFSASALGDTIPEARDRAYALANEVRFDDAWHRTDIASDIS